MCKMRSLLSELNEGCSLHEYLHFCISVSLPDVLLNSTLGHLISLRRMLPEKLTVSCCLSLWESIIYKHFCKGTSVLMSCFSLSHKWLFYTHICVHSLGLPGRPHGCVLWWCGRAPLPLFVFSSGCLCALCHVVCNFPSVDTNRQQVSAKRPPYPITYCTTVHSLESANGSTLSVSVFLSACVGGQIWSREKEYDDIDEEDPFNPQAQQISYNPRRSNTHSFCSFTSSLGSQASLHPPPQSASNVMPPPEYM